MADNSTRPGKGAPGGSGSAPRRTPKEPTLPGYEWTWTGSSWAQTPIPKGKKPTQPLPDGYEWFWNGSLWGFRQVSSGGGDGGGGGTTTTTTPTTPSPGAAWNWNSSTGKWEHDDEPTSGGPWIWDDNSGWIPDVSKISERKSARETLEAWFKYYGIEDASTTGNQSLSQLIYGWVEGDKSMDWIRLELRKSDQYKARFPGMEELSKKGMAISEAEYISNERAYTQVLKAAGMPTGFYDDRQDFANFMVAEVSPQELSSRVQIAKDYVQLYAPKSVRDQLKALYGFSDDEMAAYVLDTSQDKMKSLAVIEAEYTQRRSQAQVGGAAADAGLGVSASLRDQIAAMGYDYNQAASGFIGAKSDAPLYSRLGNLYGEKTSTEELVQETFGLGGAAETTTKKKKLASRERAAFSGTSGIGASSLGTNQAGRQ